MRNAILTIKVLERGKDLTLEQVRTIASTPEMTELYAKHMDTESAPSVNRVHGRSQWETKTQR